MKTIGDVYKNIGKPIDIGELSFFTAMNAVMSMVLGGNSEEGKGLRLRVTLKRFLQNYWC